MSVIVKGMEMPKKCNECQFCVNGFTEKAPVYECAAEGDENVSVLVDDYGKPFDFRPDWCPLVEIPTPHGRLIDADAIDYRNDAMHDGRENLVVEASFISGVVWVNDCINNTPTIIEAEDT